MAFIDINTNTIFVDENKTVIRIITYVFGVYIFIKILPFMPNSANCVGCEMTQISG